MKAKTIDEYCKQPPGSFKEFIKRKEAFLQEIEKDREERIRAARETARDLAWAV